MHYLLAGELDSTFSFEVAFPLFIKNNVVRNPHSKTRDSLSIHSAITETSAFSTTTAVT